MSRPVTGAAYVCAPVQRWRLAQSLQELAGDLACMARELAAGRPDDRLGGAVHQLAVLCSMTASGLLTSTGEPLEAATVWRIEELVDLAQLAIGLAERDLDPAAPTVAAVTGGGP